MLELPREDGRDCMNRLVSVESFLQEAVDGRAYERGRTCRDLILNRHVHLGVHARMLSGPPARPFVGVLDQTKALLVGELEPLLSVWRGLQRVFLDHRVILAVLAAVR